MSKQLSNYVNQLCNQIKKIEEKIMGRKLTWVPSFIIANNANCDVSNASFSVASYTRSGKIICVHLSITNINVLNINTYTTFSFTLPSGSSVDTLDNTVMVGTGRLSRDANTYVHALVNPTTYPDRVLINFIPMFVGMTNIYILLNYIASD